MQFTELGQYVIIHLESDTNIHIYFPLHYNSPRNIFLNHSAIHVTLDRSFILYPLFIDIISQNSFFFISYELVLQCTFPLCLILSFYLSINQEVKTNHVEILFKTLPKFQLSWSSYFKLIEAISFYLKFCIIFSVFLCTMCR